MHLDGIHHISCITGNAARNLDFYTRVLGMRLVAKTVNQDDPHVYHLFYADYDGSPGADLTFFEYPGALPGRAGAGMVHRIAMRVASEESLDFWAKRLADESVEVARLPGRIDFADPEGLGLALVVDQTTDPVLSGRHPEIPPEHDLRGFDHVVAYGNDIPGSRQLLETVLNASRDGEAESWEVRGVTRGGRISFEAPPAQRGRPGGGTVHHVAWATERSEHAAWLAHLGDHGVASTPVIDRHYFQSIYFREPSGILYELATKGPGFTIDDPLEELGRRLILPPRFESQRTEIEARLSPIPDVARGAASERRS
ncbi:MAG: VOC family protein [Gemmatimonadota bacterium]